MFAGSRARARIFPADDDATSTNLFDDPSAHASARANAAAAVAAAAVAAAVGVVAYTVTPKILIARDL